MQIILALWVLRVHCKINAEINYEYKRIVLCIVFKYDDKIFCTSKKKKQTEHRLHDKLSIGIGTNINDKDISKNDFSFNWGIKREIEEEIFVKKPISPKFIGVINNNGIEMDSVHIGVCFFWVSFKISFC